MSISALRIYERAYIFLICLFRISPGGLNTQRGFLQVMEVRLECGKEWVPSCCRCDTFRASAVQPGISLLTPQLQQQAKLLRTKVRPRPLSLLSLHLFPLPPLLLYTFRVLFLSSSKAPHFLIVFCQTLIVVFCIHRRNYGQRKWSVTLGIKPVTRYC